MPKFTNKQARFLAKEFNEFRAKYNVFCPFWPLTISGSAEKIKFGYDSFPRLCENLFNDVLQRLPKDDPDREIMLEYLMEFKRDFWHPENINYYMEPESPFYTLTEYVQFLLAQRTGGEG